MRKKKMCYPQSPQAIKFCLCTEFKEELHIKEAVLELNYKKRKKKITAFCYAVIDGQQNYLVYIVGVICEPSVLENPI